jgi:hypothetical protein
MPQQNNKPLPMNETQAKIAAIVAELEPAMQQRVMEAVATAYTTGWNDCAEARREAQIAMQSALIH